MFDLLFYIHDEMIPPYANTQLEDMYWILSVCSTSAAAELKFKFSRFEQSQTTRLKKTTLTLTLTVCVDDNMTHEAGEERTRRGELRKFGIRITEKIIRF